VAGLGTVINIVAIIVGGIIGLICGKAVTPRIQDTLMKATGICVIFIGICGTIEKMLVIEDGSLKSYGTMMIIISFALGSLFGEIVNIEKRIEQFGEWLKAKSGSSKDKRFVEGFVTTSLTVCIGAMAIVGSIQDGLYGDYSILAAKAALDFIMVMILTPSLGKGCVFSAIPVGILQGVTTLCAKLIEPVMTDKALDNLSLTGSMLIFCVGLNLVRENKIKVANMLPAIAFAVILAFVM